MIIAAQILGFLLLLTLLFAMGYSYYIRKVFFGPILDDLKWLSDHGHDIFVNGNIHIETQRLERLTDELQNQTWVDMGLQNTIKMVRGEAVDYLMKRDPDFFLKYHYYKTWYYRMRLMVLREGSNGHSTITTAFFREQKGFDL